MKNKDYNYIHPFTVWETVKNDLELNIINDVYKAGERFPSINDLVEIYNISVNTAGKVLDSLRNDNILLNKRGVGFFLLPFAKSKLLQKWDVDIDKKVEEIITSAKKIGYSKEKLLSAISEKWG